MFFLKARPESDWHGVRGVSEITVRPEIFFEADRDFQDVQRDFSSPEIKPPKRRLNLFMRKRKTPKESESNPELKSASVQDARNDSSSKTKAKKKFSFMRNKTKSNPENIAQSENSTLAGYSDSSQNDANEFKYSDVSTFVKIQDCDLSENSFMRGDLKTLMKVVESVPEESPQHSSPLGNYEGTSISESFSWKTDIWKDPWNDPPQSPSTNSWTDDQSESQTSSTLGKRQKPFFPFRLTDSTKSSDKRGSCRKYGKKGIDLETTKQLNQMISLVASEESDDPWEESWNRWQSSETFTADSMSESERMTPESGWADFSIFDKPQQIVSPTVVSSGGKTISERLTNTSKDSTESIASQDNVPPLYERDSSPVFNFASGKNQKRPRPRSWFRSSSKYNNSVLQEAQTLLDILHESFPEQELGSPETDLRTV